MPDAPDYLNAKEKAKEIADDIISLFEENKTNYREGEVGYYSDQPSRMYAIYGGWGTGKTRVLEELQQIIESEKKVRFNFFGKKFSANTYEVVWFRPWEYEDEGSKVDQKLLAKILEKASLSKKIQRYVVSFAKNFLIVLLITVTIGALISLGFEETRENLLYYSQRLDILYLIFGAVLVVSVISIFSRKIFSLFRWVQLSSLDFQKAEELFAKISKPSAKHEEITKILNTNLGKNQKIFVFVDDLDRCRKETVINLLEHTKHFYSIDQLYFIFAIDKDVTSNYISLYYKYSSDEQHIKGYQYLDKIFVNSTVYKPIDLRRKFEEILRKNNLFDELNSIDRETYYQLIEFYANFNIRKIENLVERFASIYFKIHKSRIVTWENRENGYITLDMIFRWCLIYEFSPETFESKEWKEKRYNIYELHKELLSHNPLRSGQDKYIYSFNSLRDSKSNDRLPFRLEQIYHEPKVRFRRENVDKTALGVGIGMQLKRWGKVQDNEILDHFVNAGSEFITIIND